MSIELMERRVNMTTEARIQLTSTELGTLWMTYRATRATITKCEYMKNKTIDKEAQNIITGYITDAQIVVDKIISVFNNEEVPIPIAFGESDIVREAPPLFDDIFHIMIIRQMMKLNFGHCAMYTTMSYMKEVQDILMTNNDISSKFYIMATNYLLEKGVLAKPPYVTMPKQAEIIKDKNYASGINLFSDKRQLDTIEVGFLNEVIQNNIFGMQLMIGFAQASTDNDIKQYFLEGSELAKEIISKVTKVLLESNIQAPSTWAGKVTDSTIAPLSEKLMMFTTSIMSSTAIGVSIVGTPFSMRTDLQMILALISKDILPFAKKGGKLMIEKGIAIISSY